MPFAKKDIPGSEAEGLTINFILWKALSKDGRNHLEKNIPHLIREYNSNDVSGNLRKNIRRLKERLRRGEDQPEIQMMLRIILRSKLKMLEDQQGSCPGTPATTDDEDEDEKDDHPRIPKALSVGEHKEEWDETLQDNTNKRCPIPTTTPACSDSAEEVELWDV